MFRKFRLLIALGGLVALLGCGAPDAGDRGAGIAVPAAEIALARQRLGRTQRLSFLGDREYCGYLGRTRSGRLVVTRMQRGQRDSCTPPPPRRGMTLLASLHTHGAYDRDVPAEFPTTLDMDSDAAEGVNGYIGTPGGRLWLVDSAARVAYQLCGPGCLPQDPQFHAGDDGVIRRAYRYRELLRLELGG